MHVPKTNNNLITKMWDPSALHDEIDDAEEPLPEDEPLRTVLVTIYAR